ncbi:hypothetical protein [Nocardia sp. NPDC050175]|uniref:TPR repeat region-containing protein n=1 Tax=Nocardia sp. NPDC050175 TaxID=3364317 RepID=UPI0037B8880F
MTIQIPTLGQVYSWQPETLTQAGNDLEAAGKNFSDRMAEAQRAVDNTALRWQGNAASAASARALTEFLAASRAFRAADAVAQSFISAGSTIAGYKAALVKIHGEASSAGMSVWPDGGVTAPDFPNAKTDAVAAMVQGNLNRAAADFQTRLKEQLANAGSAIAAAKATIAAGLDDLAAHGGPGGGKDSGGTPLSGPAGAALGKKIHDAVASGQPIPPELLTELGEDMKASGVPPEQLAAYLQGNGATIPAATQEFTQQFFNNAGADGFIAASEQLKTQGPAGQTSAAAMSNALLMLSDEKVGTGRDGNGKPTSPGSYDRLPTDIKQLISTRVGTQGPDANTQQYPDMGQRPENANMNAFLTKQNKLLDALGMSDQGIEPGTKTSTELYRQGSHLAWQQTHNNQLNPDSGYPLDDSISKSVEIAARNHEGTTAILTGQGGPEILGSGYHSDTDVMPLLQRHWPDGPNGPAINSMLDWIHQDAQVTVAPGDPHYQSQLTNAELAGRSAHGLSQILSTTHSSDGTNNFNVLSTGENSADLKVPHGAQMTPGVAQHVAGALAPYVGNMAGAAENLTGTHGFGALNPVESTRIFTLLDGDPKAAAIINGAAIAQAHNFDRAFALGQGGPELALESGRLRGLVEGGIAAESGLHGYDDQSASAHRKEQLGAGFMTAKEYINLGVKALPYEKYVWSPMANSIEAFLKDPTVGAINDKPSTPYPAISYDNFDLTEQQTDVRADAGRRYTMLQSLVDAGRVDPNALPGNFTDHGALKPFEDLKSGDLASVPKILEGAGLNRDDSNQYVIDARSGDNEINQIVFGGNMTTADQQLFVSVLRGDKVPAHVNQWK